MRGDAGSGTGSRRDGQEWQKFLPVEFEIRMGAWSGIAGGGADEKTW